MTIEQMVNALMIQWPTPLTHEDATLVVDAMLSANGGIDPADVRTVLLVEKEFGGLDIQLAMDEDKIPKVFT